ncbi:MAG: NAD(P)-dependent oxidoreductase, partial [Anaerolineae bacterium]|nr:NAD(P)-dependent oxidoreductase [Anaerolineae bacterium]
DEVLALADFLCLTCNLTPENRRMINSQTLGMMKSTSYLLNMARGPLVDETALAQALQNGKLAGAALDVYEVEPLPADSPFRTMDNVILGSHNANNLQSANEYVNRNSVRNLLKGFGEAVDDV